jgi:hypothetical protein
MYYFLIFGVIFSLFLKRNPITIIENVIFKVPLLLISCLVIQISLELLAVNYADKKYPAILFLTFLGMLIGLYLNRHISGIKWIFIGLSINILALIIHGGLMPVSENALNMAGLQNLVDYSQDSRHQEMGDSFFWWLGDWIPLIIPFGKNFVLSPGDVVVGVGLILFCIHNSTKRS